MATVCGYCLWLLFVATVCGYCLWLLFVFVATLCRASASILTTIHTHGPHPRRSSAGCRPSPPAARRRRVFASILTGILTTILTRGPHPRSSPPASVVGWSSSRPRLYPHRYPHHYPHLRSSPPPVLTTRGSHHPRRSSPRRRRPAPLSSPVSSPLSSPPVLTTRGPHPSGLKRSSEALEAAATVRAWGVATTGLCGLGGCSDCEGA